MIFENENIEKAFDLFSFGLIILAVVIIFNNPFKKRKVKPNLSFELEQKNKTDYINDAFKTLNTARLKSIYLIAAIFIIASIIFLI